MVIDATVAVRAALSPDGFELLSKVELHAPHLLRSEASSTLAQLRWRREISSDLAEEALLQVLDAPIRHHGTTALYRRASAIARDLGWAKSYDAEYVALAQLRDEPLLTIDGRLANRVRTLVQVVGPADL